MGLLWLNPLWTGKSVCLSENCMNTIQIRIMNFCDVETFLEAFQNKKWHNCFAFWDLFWCLYSKTPSCWSKGFTIQRMFFLHKWVIFCGLLFEFVIMIYWPPPPHNCINCYYTEYYYFVFVTIKELHVLRSKSHGIVLCIYIYIHHKLLVYWYAHSVYFKPFVPTPRVFFCRQFKFF